MIRNIIAYPLPHGWPHIAQETAELLSRRKFMPCGPQDTVSTGFVEPRDEAQLCEAIGGRYLFCHQHEEKILPASAVNEYVELRCEEIKRHQGFNPGRKQRKTIKEEVTAELLPKAFTKKRRTLGWINKERSWLILEATSAKRAEDVLSDMRNAFEAVPVDQLRLGRNPARAMLEWLDSGEAPECFTIDSDCELVSHAEDEGVVRYANWDLSGEDVRYQLSIGRAPTLLGLTFNDRISFILTNRMELKRIVLLDVIYENAQEADNAIELFDSQFTLAAGEIENVLEALVGELGGLVANGAGDLVDQADDARRAFDQLAESVASDGTSFTVTTGDGHVIAGAGNEHDPLYPEATRVVLKERRPSISLIQRHLRIGYNRAARLLEQMEHDGIVSAMRMDGSREVLAA